MTSKDYFILGCKLFGVYCLVLGVPALAATIPSFVQPQQMGEDYRQIMMATKIAARLIPIILIFGGFYLIRGGERLYRFAYPNATENTHITEEKLLLFVKMLGIFLIVTYFPNLLRTIASYITYTNFPKVYNLMQQQQFTYLHAASSIWGVGFGLYLFKGGNFIVKMCMKGLTQNEEVSENNAG